MSADDDRRAIHHCHAKDCTTKCLPERLMCLKHWKMVPLKIRERVWAHYRQGQCDDMQPSKEWLYAAQDAINAVAALEALQKRPLPSAFCPSCLIRVPYRDGRFLEHVGPPPCRERCVASDEPVPVVKHA